MTLGPIADAVIVAAGSSRRMSGQDKLAIDIAGRSVLRRSVDAFASAPEVASVIVVTSAERVPDLEAAPWIKVSGAQVVPGGRRRQDSVAAGVQAASADYVLVHDAARPLVSGAVISRVVVGAMEHGAAIPVLPVVDALKRVEGDGRIGGTAERAGLYRAQTPQGARRELLAAAAARYASGEQEIKDEAELLGLDGVSVATVPGEAANIKVTLPEDVALAQRLAGGPETGRTTMGRDSHPFGPEDGLHLGGLLIEDSPRLHGHSDGDVLLHALADALLAACGRGDLGRLYPSGDPTTRGIDSREMATAVVQLVDEAGLEVTSVDATILGARPRLGHVRLDAMASLIAEMLGLQPGRVSVKAGTGNLSGDEGAGRAISASCLVNVVSR